MSKRLRVRMLVLAAAVVWVSAFTDSASASSWHYKYFHINAYGHQNSCSKTGHERVTSSDPVGWCQGRGENSGAQSDPFNHTVQWNWSTQPAYCGRTIPTGYARVMSMQSTSGNSSHLCGYVTSNWGAFAVQSGRVEGHSVSTSQDLSRAGHQGGAFAVDLVHRSDNGHNGYVLRLSGWLHY